MWSLLGLHRSDPGTGSRAFPESIQAAVGYLRRRRHDLEPRKLWPKSAGRKGRIIAAGPGRALAFADDPGWPEVIAELAAPDADPSDELTEAVVALLRQWRPDRPDVIVGLPTPGNQRRTSTLSQALGERFGIPVLDPFTWTGGPVASDLTSGRQVQQIDDQLQCSEDAVRGRVLLISATARSLWTVTVAAAQLREAGADSVIPLVVQRLP